MYAHAMTRAITYRRVSTDEQATSGAGLDAQARALADKLAAAGWEHTGDYADEGVSGKVAPEARPALSAALAALEAGDADVLVVAKLDRLTRSMLAMSELLRRAEQARWSLVILDADVDTTTAGGRLVANVLGSVAEWERMVIAERTRAALAARKAQGMRLGRPVILADATRARVAALKAEGLSLRSIAARLTDEGTPTATGGRWHPSTVRAVLASLEADRAAELVNA